MTWDLTNISVPMRIVMDILISTDAARLLIVMIIASNPILEHLNFVKQQGYAVDDEENEVGIRCVAAPVRNDRGKVIAGISISGPTVRMSLERIQDELKKEVMKTAAEVSSKLGFRPVREGR